MSDRTQSLLLTSVAFTTGILFAHLAGPRIADAQSASPAPPPPDVSSRVAYLERAYKGTYSEIQTLKAQIKALQQASGAATRGAGGAATLGQKVAELEKKLENHTHEYLQEGRASDGSIRAVPPDQFSGQGLNSTGLFRVGKPVFH